MLNEKILTIEEVSQHLRVPVETIEEEIASGRLPAMKIGGHDRIRESALDHYMEKVSVASSVKELNHFQLGSASEFEHTWPDKKVESFTDAHEGVVSYAGKEHHVKVGFTFRKSAGRRRSRSLVLVDRYATVEFVAADEKSQGKMASIIRDRSGKQIPVGATIPAEYRDLPVGPYRDVVAGSGASNGLAVICDATEIEVMVKHALIRYQYRKDRT